MRERWRGKYKQTKSIRAKDKILYNEIPTDGFFKSCDLLG